MLTRRSSINCLSLISVFSCSVLSAVIADEPRPERFAVTTIKDVAGKPLTLKPPRGGVLALVFQSQECPISNGYSPTLNEIVKAFPEDKLTLAGLFVDPDRTDAEIAAHAKEFALTYPVASDRAGRLSSRLAVSVTPEVVVIDDQNRIRYQGRIDDQYVGRGLRNAHPMSHDLRDAIRSVIDGNEIATTRQDAVGCPLPTPSKEAAVPTYSDSVADILQNRCLDCHQPGQVGPFSLLTYEQARKRAIDIATVAETRAMPPWKAAGDFGEPFLHPRSMTETEIKTLIDWADAGAPEGTPGRVLQPSRAEGGWSLGNPDLIVEMPHDFNIPASGDDLYRCFVIPTNLPEDVYVSAIEYQPGNRAVVHHVLCYVDTSGKARKLDDAEPGAGYTCFSGPMIDPHGDLGGWAPGNEPSFLPDGIGRSLPKRADIVMQVHYHPTGKTETDRTRIGLYFTKTPVKQVLHWTAAANQAMFLPKDNPRIEISARWKAPVDLDAYAVSPHMHLLGKDMTMVLTEPDGTVRPLIRIDDWDFQWQNTYYFVKPLRIKKGTVLDVVAHFDNSKNNPRNPFNPPRDITWGEATTDEMCIGFLAVTKADQDLTQAGQVDDLGRIIRKGFEEQEREYRERLKDRKEASKPGGPEDAR